MKGQSDSISAGVLARFLRYAKIETTSDRHSDIVPSTPGQWELLRMLESELKELGLVDVEIEENGFLIGRIPANVDGVDPIGFMAHVDTVGEVSGKGVDPLVHEAYDGEAIALADGVVLDPEDEPLLKEHVGETILTSDGTTLLGADDKAGVAEIMTLAEALQSNPDLKHGEIELIFTPDEETGRGMDFFPRDRIRSVACYTLDGSEEGVIETECFNASKAEVEFRGVSAHTGTARGKLVNAVSMLGSFLTALPRNESPEATDERYGFYAPIESGGTVEHARCMVLLRDFDTEGLKRREQAIFAIARAIEAGYPGGSVEITIEQQYENMQTYLEKDTRVASLLEEAIRDIGLEPKRNLIRGGTDGSRLSALGVPTPNIFTGGHNYHSRTEWACVSTMGRAVETLIRLCSLWAG